MDDWKVGARFTCERGRTWLVESMRRVGTHTLLLGARCVLSSRECPDAIGLIANFDATKVTKLEDRRGTKN